MEEWIMNIHMCLLDLVDCEIIKVHFPDVKDYKIPEWMITTQTVQLFMNSCKSRLGDETFSKILQDNRSHEFEHICSNSIKILKQRGFLAEAFGFGVLFKLLHKGDYLHELDEMRKMIVKDVNKYEESMKIFEPILSIYFDKFTKSAFYYLDMMLDGFLIQKAHAAMNYGRITELSDELAKLVDFQLSYTRKRYELEYYPSGKTSFIYKIIRLVFSYLLIHRFKQARNLIAIASEMMKTVDKKTVMFKKLLEMFYMAKTLYLAKLLEVSEYYENFLKSPIFEPVANELLPKDKVIDFGIPLPDGEDPELPVDLVTDAAKRKEIYKKLQQHKKKLQKSSLPKIPQMYRFILKFATSNH